MMGRQIRGQEQLFYEFNLDDCFAILPREPGSLTEMQTRPAKIGNTFWGHSMHHISRYATALATTVFLICSPAGAADLGSAEVSTTDTLEAPPRAWELRVTPYAWLVGMNGDVTVNGRKTEVDASFIDLVEKSDSIIALFGNFEARKGRFSLYNDSLYAKLTASKNTLTNLNPVPGLSLTLGADVGAEFQLVIVEAGATYQLFQHHSGGGWKDSVPSRSTALDLVVGGRYWNIETDLKLGLTATVDFAALGLRRSRSLAIADGGTVDWFDPLVGLRLRHQLAPGQDLFARGDIGGFGVGSDFSWNAIAGYSWECRCRPFGATLSGFVGYRALYADYAQGSGNRQFEWDMLIHGPVIGASFRF